MDNGKKNRQAQTRLAAQLMKRILVHFRGQIDEALRPQGVTTAPKNNGSQVITRNSADVGCTIWLR